MANKIDSSKKIIDEKEKSLIEDNGILTNKDKVEYLSDYLDFIEELKENWNLNDIWYRGVPDSAYKLIPSIYRKSIWRYNQKAAQRFYIEFKRRAKPFIDYENKSMWEIYQLMQHYGAPTRLLDWTEGSLIALFFAILDLDKTKSPCVWCIDPFSLNKQTIGKNDILYTGAYSTSSKALVNKYLIDKSELPDKPIAILPHFSDKRILSQKSCFTIHGKNKKGIEEQLKNNPKARIARICIDKEFVEDLMTEIVSTGISFSVLFPDLEGLAEELKYEFEML